MTTEDKQKLDDAKEFLRYWTEREPKLPWASDAVEHLTVLNNSYDALLASHERLKDALEIIACGIGYDGAIAVSRRALAEADKVQL